MSNKSQSNSTRRWRLFGLSLEASPLLDEGVLAELARSALHLGPDALLSWRIEKKALDARRKPPRFVYCLDLTLPAGGRPHLRGRGLHLEPLANDPLISINSINSGTTSLSLPPIVVGSGPAGIFAALLLARRGYRPLLLERGEPVEVRAATVEKFWREGIFNPESNVQFGEGGAGTFSDGKLTSRSKDPLARLVLEELTAAGAEPAILYWHKPHIGTDKLRLITANLRRELVRRGGRIAFGAKLEDLSVKDGRLVGLRIGEGKDFWPVSALILATGHSARDTYRMLEQRGVALAPKAFAFGLRLQQEQALIDRIQYGCDPFELGLPAADYRLSWRDPACGRGVYTFCMCPGGHIVNAAGESKGLVTNGMSFSARDSGQANSAVVVTVNPDDFGNKPLAGLSWQRQWEEKAYQLGGANHALPAQTVTDFQSGKASFSLPEDFKPKALGAKPADLRLCLPPFVSEGIAGALASWEKDLPGFCRGALLAGVESRTSAPLRILRGEKLESLSVKGLYPAGEGAGYTGGIISSAIDGLKVAAALVGEYDRPVGDFMEEFLNEIRN
ncbi:MAG: NAD(P)-binding protein [Clostridiales bacterium]|nr:NAD(P)-binding protein [Clostridiales bacterium]MDR2711980.1 NAD(P)-binding protein [Clostridiales bacterium]